MLIIAIILSTVSAASAEGFDITPFNDPEVFTINEYSNDGVAIIESGMSPSSRSFQHVKQSDQYISSTQFDLLLLEYNTPQVYPVWRLSINFFSSDAFHEINSITFVLKNKKYTFNNLYEPSACYKAGDSYLQRLCIIFGYGNMQFLEDLNDLTKGTSSYEELKQISIPVIFTGKDTTKGTLNTGFTMEYRLFRANWLLSNAFRDIVKVEGTPCSIL